jgi:hypothetical protein
VADARGPAVTGVIVAVERGTTRETVLLVHDQLESIFPGVTFAVIAGGTSSVAFEFDAVSEGDR